VTSPVMPQGVEQQSPPVPRGELGHLDLSRIAQDLQIRKVQVEAVVQLLDEENTIPFITRYRKERTGGLDEEILRIIQERVGNLRHLAERKATILKSVESQGKLTDELRAAILAADNPKRLEDLYLPYKPKKRTLAQTARERGLENLALAIWRNDEVVSNLNDVLPTLVNPEQELHTPEDVLTGAGHILAELIAETADIRAAARAVLWDTGKLETKKSEKLAEGQGLEVKDYFNFTEAVRQIPPHRISAINRGEKDNALTVRLICDTELARRVMLERLPLPTPPVPAPEATEEQTPSENGTAAAGQGHHSTNHGGHGHHRGHRGGPPFVSRLEDLQRHPHREFLEHVAEDALNRLLLPSLEREIRRELTSRSEGHAVSVFARNLRSKLLASPLHGKRVLAVDPGFRNGCKVAVLDETGNLLDHGVVFPHPPQNRKGEARTRLETMICRHRVQVIAIGNGTACRETEELVSEMIASLEARRLGLPDPHPIPPPPPPKPPRQPKNPPPAPVVETAPALAEAPPAEGVPAPVIDPVILETPPGEAPASEPPAPAPAEVAPEAVAPPSAEAVTPPAEAVAPETPPVETVAQEAVVSEPVALPPVEAAAPEPPPPPPPPEPLPDAPAELAYVIVNEAGASVYSASPIAREEFPEFDANLRGTISIGRRLQDPLSELVKIDPQHVGVGQYQHDMSPKHLKEALEGVVESCVNAVGVDLNTASVPLLRHVSGLNQHVARELVDFRKTNGSFRSREQLQAVNGIGPARWTQAAGFLKITGGENPLDATWIHPESYPVALQLLTELGVGAEALNDRQATTELQEKLKALPVEEVATRLQVGVPTLRDILEALARPGRDPREDLPPPVFKKGILKIEDLQPNMELKGTVLNVVDFGAFIDIGLKDSGLVHISQMANRYVKSPYDVVAVGDVVSVWVLKVEPERQRVSLTMIQPGTERKPPERRPPQRREGGREGGREQGHGPVAHGGPPRGDQAPREQGAGAGGGRDHRGQGDRRGGPPREGGGRQGGGRQGGGRPTPPRTAGQPALPRGQTRLGANARQQGRKPEQPQTAEQAAETTPAETPKTPPRKPKKQKTELSQAALAGKESLGTFAELAAFWDAKKTKPPEETAPPPPAEGGEAPTPPPAE
jgi:protein Tex